MYLEIESTAMKLLTSSCLILISLLYLAACCQGRSLPQKRHSDRGEGFEARLSRPASIEEDADSLANAEEVLAAIAAQRKWFVNQHILSPEGRRKPSED
uniref:Gastrin domain-containing protein n=1 Tax=Macrostomum lignano TaxID=282301 RepID=A0A1I8GWV9_9PLAT